jgi:hypothetical protein
MLPFPSHVTISFQSLGHKNVILEYAEVQTNKELKQKINGLFTKHRI